MNKVDQLVRDLLHVYPTLFADRLDALRNIFSNSGYEWDADGCLQPVHSFSRDPRTMDFSDLDEDDARLAEEADKDIEVLGDLHKMRAFEAKRERMNRELIAANIETVAKTMPDGARLQYSQLENMSLYSLRNLPANIDKDWLAAIEEFIDVVKVSYNMVFGLHYDNPLKGDKAPEPSMFSRMPPRFQTLYTELCEADDKIDAQTGRRARNAAFMAPGGDFDQMMAEIMGEMKAEDEKPV